MKSSKNLITLFCFIFLFNIIQSEDACATATPSIKYDLMIRYTDLSVICIQYNILSPICRRHI